MNGVIVNYNNKFLFHLHLAITLCLRKTQRTHLFTTHLGSARKKTNLAHYTLHEIKKTNFSSLKIPQTQLYVMRYEVGTYHICKVCIAEALQTHPHAQNNKCRQQKASSI